MKLICTKPVPTWDCADELNAMWDEIAVEQLLASDPFARAEVVALAEVAPHLAAFYARTRKAS